MAEPKVKPKGFLRSKIVDPAISREVSALTEAVATIAADNKTPFFPAYTGHGIDHLQAVLDWCVKLTPKDAKRLLVESDAAVIIGGALLHDVAMHLHVPGFIELVGGDWPAPLPWFDRPQGRRPADRPWAELWDDFKIEARHFDHTEIVRLLGPDHEGTPQVVFDDDVRRAGLTEADRLYIGEFLRRHHARLAHEIAVHGFPGLGDELPAPEPGLPTTLRELMGLVARSHNEDLRLVVDHMKDHRGSMERRGVHVPYAAALLRIADFAQLDFRRAPSLLLRMAAPQSQISIDEWAKHKAVEMVIDDGDDPDAIRIEVSSEIALHTYLQLEELFDGLQRELDICSAVLAEVYGASRRLAPLRLAKRRVRHNMASADLQDALPFVPRESRLRSAEDMFRLVIHDLYGDHPWVAGRELAQNALDAVRERWRVEASGVAAPAGETRLDPSRPGVDVLVEVIVDDDDQLTLRISDRGIGMTADTVVDYFLRAGASLGPTSRELAEIPEGQGARYVKAGRFGVGVLAAFLLGDEVEVRTRHLTEETGLRLTARLDSTLVPITRGVPMEVGTQIEVRAAPDACEALVRNVPGVVHRFLRLDGKDAGRWPTVTAAHVLGASVRQACALASPRVRVHIVHAGETMMNLPGLSADLGHELDEDEACELRVAGFDHVSWTANRRGRGAIVLNGILIVDPQDPPHRRPEPTYRWSDPRLRSTLVTPSLRVASRGQGLPLTLNRFRLRDPALPFEQPLLRSLGGAIVAEALLRPGAHMLLRLTDDGPITVFAPSGTFPFLPGLAAMAGFDAVDVVVGMRSSLNGVVSVDLDVEEAHLGVARRPLWPRRMRDSTIYPLAGRSAERTNDQVSRVMHAALHDPFGSLMRSARFRYGGSNTSLLDALRAEFEFGPEATDPASDETVDAFRSQKAASAIVVVEVATPADGGGGTASILAETWMDIVGGPIPYDEGERAELVARIEREHPEMRPHLERQRRIAGQEGPR